MNFIGLRGSSNKDLVDLNCTSAKMPTPRGSYDYTEMIEDYAEDFFCHVGQGVLGWLRNIFKLV